MNIYVYAAGLLFSTGTIIGVMQWRLNRLEKDHDEDNKSHKEEHITIKDDQAEINLNLWKVIGDLRVKVELHDKDSANARLEIEKRLGSTDSSINVNKSQYDEILRQIGELRAQISEIKRDRD